MLEAKHRKNHGYKGLQVFHLTWDNPAETGDLDLNNKRDCKFGSIICVYLVGEVQSEFRGFSLLPIGGICLGGWLYLGRTLVGGAPTCLSSSLRKCAN